MITLSVIISIACAILWFVHIKRVKRKASSLNIFDEDATPFYVALFVSSFYVGIVILALILIHLP